MKPLNMFRRYFIKRESRTRATLTRRYRELVAQWKIGKRCCFPNCKKPATECHHSRGRIGRLLLDVRFWKPVCGKHHDWIHDHPAEARQIGLLAPVGQWNTVPKGGE